MKQALKIDLQQTIFFFKFKQNGKPCMFPFKGFSG